MPRKRSHDPEVVIETGTTIPAGTTLTMEMIDNARRLAYDDYATPEAFMPRAEMEQHPRYRGNGRRATVELRHRDDLMGVAEIQVCVPELHLSSRIDGREFERRPGFREELARSMARQMGREVEAQVYEAMERALTPRHRIDMRPGGVNNLRAAAWDQMRHAIDFGLGVAAGLSRPDTPTAIPLARLEGLKEIKFRQFTVTLLATDQAIWDEGETMGHCLGKSYTGRIMKGSYLAFHADFPGSKNGLTLGYRDVAWNGVHHRWEFDQCKGKANSTKHNNRADVVDLRTYVLNLLNNGA